MKKSHPFTLRYPFILKIKLSFILRIHIVTLIFEYWSCENWWITVNNIIHPFVVSLVSNTLKST